MSVEAVSFLFVLLVAVAVAWPVVRSKQTVTTIELLRSELQVEKEAREAQERRCTERLADQDRRHARELGELRGRLDAMTPEFARTLAGLLQEGGV